MRSGPSAHYPNLMNPAGARTACCHVILKSNHSGLTSAVCCPAATLPTMNLTLLECFLVFGGTLAALASLSLCMMGLVVWFAGRKWQ